MNAPQRIIEWLDNSIKPFHLEFKNEYDGNWHLRLFPNNLPCAFGDKEEAIKYANDNPIPLTCIIHNL